MKWAFVPFLIISEVHVGDLHISVNLQSVNLIELMHAVREVAHVFPVDKHLVLLAPATDWHLGSRQRTSWTRARRQRHDSEAAATHVKVLALPEGVEVVLSLLPAPGSSQLAVPHNNLLLHPGIKVEDDVLGAAPHKVETDSAARTWKLGNIGRIYFAFLWSV